MWQGSGRHFLKVRYGLGWLALHHQQNAQVVVAVLIRRIEVKPHAKGLLSQIGILHGDVGIAEIVVRLHGGRIYF